MASTTFVDQVTVIPTAWANDVNTAVYGTPTWITPSFQNSWGNFGGVWSPGGYYKDAIGTVHLRGVLSTAAAIGTVIFTLPSGYRPPYSMAFMVVSNNSWGIVSVEASSGNVTANAGSNTNFFLDGVAFSIY